MPDTGTTTREVRTICRCCSAGCGIRVRVDADNQVQEVRGDPEHALSRGYICPKGYNLAWHHTRPDLLTGGRIRGRAATWQETAEDLVTAIQGVAGRDGPGAIGCYTGTGGGGLDVASARTIRALMGALGSKQIYSSTSVDNLPSWEAGDMVTGAGMELQPRWWPEDEASKLVIFFGCNPIVSHGYFTILPDASRRIRQYRKGGGKVWAVDPRVSETAKAGDGHLACLPNTDWLLMAWLLKEVLKAPPHPERLAEISNPGDFDQLAALVAPITRTMVAETCDVAEADLQRLLDDIRAAGRFAIVTGSGALFSTNGLTLELLRYAVLAAADSLDQPGGVWFEIGQAAKFDERETWNASPVEGRRLQGPKSRPDLHSHFGEYPCIAMADEIEAGNLKALIVSGGNPLVAFPNPERMAAALAKLEVLAVVDIVENRLTALATHLLPGVRHLEVGSMLSWNGRAAYGPAVVPQSGDRNPAWKACGMIGEGLGLNVLQGLSLEEATGEEILRRSGKAARYDFDAMLAAGPSGIEIPKKSNWMLERVVPGGRWRIASPVLLERLDALLKTTTQPNPLALICRRQNEQTNSTNYVREAKRHDQPHLLMAATDAARLGLVNGQKVKVTSEAGAVDAALSVSDTIRPGAVSLPHGWAQANVSLLTPAKRVDPLSGQAPMSAISVTVEPA